LYWSIALNPIAILFSENVAVPRLGGKAAAAHRSPRLLRVCDRQPPGVFHGTITVHDFLPCLVNVTIQKF
jgi:hypothetical protein